MTNSHDKLCFSSAVDMVRWIKSGEVSPVEIVNATLARMDSLNPRINAFISRTDDLARAAAVEAERILRTDGPDALPPLAGIPVSIKDMTDTAGVQTTYGSSHYLGNIPSEDAPIAARIRAAGAALIGKASTPAFGWLGVTDNDIIGTTNNPWALGHTAGGSSGGSAAAVASGMGPLATGSDGGGSIRLPSALCGIVGLKPSHGRIPRGAESQLFESVDALGPMARSVADVALLLSVMAGPIEEEPYMLPEADVDYLADLRAHRMGRLRVAFCPNWGHGHVDDEVAATVAAAARHFESTLGAVVDTVQLDIADPMTHFETYYPATFKNFADRTPALIAHQQRYAILGTFCNLQQHVSSHDWFTAVTTAREKTFRAIAGLFRNYDILLTPTAPVAAWPHPADFGGPHTINGKPVDRAYIDFFRFTEPTGHTGHPSLTMNCGFTKADLPVGLQIIGSQRNDRGVLRAAAAYEATTTWSSKRPPL